MCDGGRRLICDDEGAAPVITGEGISQPGRRDGENAQSVAPFDAVQIAPFALPCTDPVLGLDE
jgi:hypothetical protein